MSRNSRELSAKQGDMVQARQEGGLRPMSEVPKEELAIARELLREGREAAHQQLLVEEHTRVPGALSRYLDTIEEQREDCADLLGIESLPPGNTAYIPGCKTGRF